MTIVNRDEFNQSEKPVIYLYGPSGNAFSLIAQAKMSLKQLDFDADFISEVVEEMTSSDYDNLVDVFEKYLGEYFIIVR